MKPGGVEGENGEPSALTEITRYSGHGLTLALSVGLFLLGGWWLDGRLGTAPAFTILGALVGAGAGFYHMLHHLVLLPRSKAKKGRRRDEGEGPAGGSRN